MNLDDYPDLLKTSEVGKIFRTSSKTVIAWIQSGHLRATQTPSKRYLIRKSDVVKQLEASEVHKPYKHPGGFGQACGACSRAAGEPVAWPCGVGQ